MKKTTARSYMRARALGYFVSAIFVLAATQTARGEYFDWIGKASETSYFDDATCWGGNKGTHSVSDGDNHWIGYGGITVSGWDEKITSRQVFSVKGALYSQYEAAPVVFVAENPGYGIDCSQQFEIRNAAEVQIQSGTYKFAYFSIGNTSGKTAKLTINGGTVRTTGNYTRIGLGKGNGILTINSGSYDNLDCTTNPNLTLGHESGSSGTLNVNGGTFTMKGFIALNYNSGAKSSAVNITGGGVLTALRIYLANAGSGGTITIDGGTLKAYTDGTDFLPAHNSLHVYAGANCATIDTGNHNITIGEDFEDKPGDIGTARFKGGATVKFTGVLAHSGRTTIDAGTVLSTAKASNVANVLTNGLSVAIPAGGVAHGTPVITLTGGATIDPAWLGAGDIVIGDASDIEGLYLARSPDGTSIVIKSNTARALVWAGASGDSWTASGKWNDGNGLVDWEDGNAAVFATANASALLDANVEAHEVVFRGDASVSGSSTLETETIVVSNGVTATVSAPIGDTLEKHGDGVLVLSESRTGKATYVAEGALKMTGGAAIGNLVLGNNPANPVVFDYDGNELSGEWTTYLTPGMDITLTNGMFSTTQNPTWTVATMPKSLTIAKDAIMTTSNRLSWNICKSSEADATNYVNIVGGSLVSTLFVNNGTYNWIMQDSRRGTLVFNVSDGGLLQFANKVFMLPCRDSTTANDTPGLRLTFNDSTFRVKNNVDLLLGHDDEGLKKNPREPILELAMTNSVLDVGSGSIYLGYNIPQSNHGGHATADFKDCVITAGTFIVHHDRPANAARFDGVTFVLAKNNGIIGAHSGFDTLGGEWEGRTPITIGTGGLTIDTKTYNGALQADLYGSGSVTKQGSGRLTVTHDQSSNGDFTCEEGTLYVDGKSVLRPVTIKDGATFAVDHSAQSSFASLTFEANTTLNVESYTGPIPVAELNLPADGTVALVYMGGAFSTGAYGIFRCPGVTVDAVRDILVPNVGGLSHAWSVEDDTLVLTVGDPSPLMWTGIAGDGKMSTAGNWYGKVAPQAGESPDFSSRAALMTINADIDAVFGLVTMGEGVTTFSNSLSATSFSDTSKIAVAANSTVTVVGDLEFATETHYISDTIASGGKFVTTGHIKTAGNAAVLGPKNASEGFVLAQGGLVSSNTASDDWQFRLTVNKGFVTRWAVGAGGISGSRYFWVYNNGYDRAYIKADADFAIDTWISTGINTAGVVIDTAGLSDPTKSWTVTANKGFVGSKSVYLTGGGKLVCNYVPTYVSGNGLAYSGDITVSASSTLAINAGKYPTTGTITINSGSTLQVAETGTVALGGGLSLRDNACLGFNYTSSAAPILDLTGKDVMFDEGETTNVVVKISAENGARAKYNGGRNVLTAGQKFAGVNVSLYSGAVKPTWVADVKEEDGEIVVYVRSPGLMIFVQ